MADEGLTGFVGEIVASIGRVAANRLAALNRRRRETCSWPPLFRRLQCGGRRRIFLVSRRQSRRRLCRRSSCFAPASTYVLLSHRSGLRHPSADAAWVNQDVADGADPGNGLVRSLPADRRRPTGSANTTRAKKGRLSNMSKSMGLGDQSHQPDFRRAFASERVARKGPDLCRDGRPSPLSCGIPSPGNWPSGMTLHVFTQASARPTALPHTVIKVSTRAIYRNAGRPDRPRRRHHRTVKATIEISAGGFLSLLKLPRGARNSVPINGASSSLARFNPGP